MTKWHVQSTTDTVNWIDHRVIAGVKEPYRTYAWANAKKGFSVYHTATVFCLSTKTMGVGSASCGSCLLEKFKVWPDNSQFSYTLN
jgi:Beta galactosidase small chain.